uniref:Uncharacterized protein n=1 Tax=Oryza brachyantha TaxID=4533 RepID=J3N5G1_ORYBR
MFTCTVPESAIMSVALSPLFEKDLLRSPRSRVGAGMSLFAASRLAVVESRRPSWTTQVGPPSCKINDHFLGVFVCTELHGRYLVTVDNFINVNQFIYNLWPLGLTFCVILLHKVCFGTRTSNCVCFVLFISVSKLLMSCQKFLVTFADR